MAEPSWLRIAPRRGDTLHVDDLVDHIRQVGVDTEREVAPLVVVADGDLPAHVAHLTGILIRFAQADAGCNVELEQNVVRRLVVPVGP